MIRGKIIELRWIEENFWHQRPQINWLSDGDKNAKLFHVAAIKEKEEIPLQVRSYLMGAGLMISMKSQGFWFTTFVLHQQPHLPPPYQTTS